MIDNARQIKRERLKYGQDRAATPDRAGFRTPGLSSMVPKHRLPAGDRHQAIPHSNCNYLEVACGRDSRRAGQPEDVEEGEASRMGIAAVVPQPGTTGAD